MKKSVAVGLLLVGIALGCGASAVAPMRNTFAQTQGRWGCYVVDRFPDAQDAASWDGAARVTDGLNQVAKHVPAGAIKAARRVGLHVACPPAPVPPRAGAASAIFCLDGRRRWRPCCEAWLSTLARAS